MKMLAEREEEVEVKTVRDSDECKGRITTLNAHASFAKVEALTVAKTLCIEKAEALVDTFPDTISKLVAKTIADTLQAKAPVKTESQLLYQ